MVRSLQAYRGPNREKKTGCITNNLPANRDRSWAADRSIIAEVMALFITLSNRQRSVKDADPRIYQMMVDALQRRSNASSISPDLGVHLKPAREMA